MSDQKWIRSSLRQLSKRLAAIGHSICPPTVGRLLRHLGYALRVKAKKQEASEAHPERNQQFEYIQAQKQRFELVDSGGSNGCRPRLWKQQLQECFVDCYSVSAVVCHYPTGCSKWNPIEH